MWLSVVRKRLMPAFSRAPQSVRFHFSPVRDLAHPLVQQPAEPSSSGSNTPHRTYSWRAVSSFASKLVEHRKAHATKPGPFAELAKFGDEMKGKQFDVVRTGFLAFLETIGYFSVEIEHDPEDEDGPLCPRDEALIAFNNVASERFGLIPLKTTEAYDALVDEFPELQEIGSALRSLEKSHPQLVVPLVRKWASGYGANIKGDLFSLLQQLMVHLRLSFKVGVAPYFEQECSQPNVFDKKLAAERHKLLDDEILAQLGDTDADQAWEAIAACEDAQERFFAKLTAKAMGRDSRRG